MRHAIFINALLFLSLRMISQTSDPGVTSTAPASGNHAFVGTHVDGTFTDWLGTGYPATAYNLLGYSSKYWGFGGATGNNIESPIIWMYTNPRSALRVRTMNYNGDMTTGTDLFTVRASGKVGIGTIDPIYKLDVRGIMASSHDNGKILAFFTSGDGNSYLNFVGGSTSSRIGFQIDGSSKMSIYNNGSVAIGTGSTGTHKLAVEGSIGAREVKVEVGTWSDYVFEEDYELPTLEEVKQHIKEKGHLINIPSAKEVEVNGIELGEMNKLLLEKIEELTLYIIAQNEEIKNLIAKNSELERLQNEMKAIRKTISELKLNQP